MNPRSRFLAFVLATGLPAAAFGAAAVTGPTLPQTLAAEGVRPLSLASADFDGDGVADLAAGFARPDGSGVVVLYRGNVDALYPHSPEARQRRTQGRYVDTPFLSTNRVLALAAPPDFLYAGDFDADGNADLAAAAAEGASIQLLPGDGTGRFGTPRITSLQGALTALAAGDIGLRDGLTDLVATIDGAGGSRALILQGVSGALSGSPATVALDRSAASIAIGAFSGSSKQRVALREDDGRIVFLEKRSRLPWKSLEPETREELDAADAALSPAAGNEAAARLTMRVTSASPSDEVLLGWDGSISIAERAVAATFVVDSTSDTNDVTPGNGICADVNGACTLRAAIQESNALAGTDTITFAIPGAGVPTIVTPGLPAITGALTIDGTTQSAGRVEITGTSNGTLITFSADACVLRGMVLNGTGNFGMRIQSNGNVVEGNYFGTTPDGTAVEGGFAGPDIVVGSGTGNRIGGTTPAARNVISGGTNAIRLDGGTATVIEGNYVGTDVTGTVDLGNTSYGMRAMTGSPGNTFGGPAPGAGNVISGNNAAGIQLGSPDNLVQGNLIGVDANGEFALGNSDAGIDGNFPGDVTIGGTAPGMGNVISGNGTFGIDLNHNAAAEVLVQGNLIGTDHQGFFAIPNQSYGIRIVGLSEALIGGSAPGAGNVISGNLLGGIFLTKFSTVYPTGNVIQGNLIGADITGTVPVGNVGSGITFEYALGTLVGGAGFGEGNTISGNQEYGIRIGGITDASANDNLIVGNLIGTNVYGTGALGNGQAGAVFTSGARGYEIGGTSPGEQNRIAFNGGAGIASLSGYPIRFRPNSVYSNAGLGVDRGNNGVTPNDPPGTFAYQNAPILSAATTSPSGTSVDGTLYSGYAATFTIHVFANPTCDPSGYGEARQYLGALSVATAAGTDTPFSGNLPTPAPAGSYITALSVAPAANPYLGATSELSFCRPVTGDPGPPADPPPLSLLVVLPAQGGNGGSVSVTVTGESIDPAATLKLTRSGQPDIPGEYLHVGEGGGNLRAIFNLTGAQPGAWDLVVTNPGPETATLPGAFTIEAGGASDLFADLIGRTRILRGRDTTFYILFGNRGAVDAYGANVILAGIPSDAIVTPLFQVAPMPQYDYVDPFDYTQIPLVAAGAEGQSLQLFVPVIPAGSRTVLAVRLRTSQPSFELRVGIGEAWFTTSDLGIAALRGPGAPQLSNETIDCLMTILKELASLALDQLIPDDCAGLVQQVMANHLPNWFGNMLEAGQEEAGTGEAIFASTQASTQIVQIGTKGALCFAEMLPAAKLFKFIMDLANLAAKLESVAEIIDKCKHLLPDWVRKPIESLIPSDPNDKIGSDGTGPEHWVHGLDPAAYQILFENKPQATAPAHEVVITDQLDLARFDLATFSFGPVTFGDFGVQTPPNVSEFSKDVDMRPTRNVIVRVGGQLDLVSGLVTWHFLSLDPATGLPSEDPDQGFLPPNTAPPGGEGSTSFAVDLLAGVSTGQEYRNKATIVFDLEAPIVTPEWFNTIDAAPPSSQVAPLPSTSCSAVPVAWSGTDAHSGVSSYDIYVSENGGALELWRAHDHGTSAVFVGAPGNTYGFASVARDAVGNEEALPAGADASTNAANPSPIVDALEPSSGPAGGTSVAFTGDGFLAGLSLTVGGVSATNVAVTDPQTADATFPGLAAGTLNDVTATNTGGCGWTFPRAWFADFLDVDQAHPFHRFVENIFRQGITAGCATPGSYCPANPVTRAQMAVFLLKSKYGAAFVPPPATGVFPDVPVSNPFAPWIEQLATESITGGCGNGNYCPGSPVTRAQMAVFLLKSAIGPNLVLPPATGVFADVPISSPFAPWIERLAADEITGGCGGNNYCPGNPVTRGQMAVFLSKTFGYVK